MGDIITPIPVNEMTLGLSSNVVNGTIIDHSNRFLNITMDKLNTNNNSVDNTNSNPINVTSNLNTDKNVTGSEKQALNSNEMDLSTDNTEVSDSESGSIELVISWSDIIRRFKAIVEEIFGRMSVRALLDSSKTVVDGMKMKWVNILLFDTLIAITTMTDLDKKIYQLHKRRKFDQYDVFRSCVVDSLSEAFVRYQLTIVHSYCENLATNVNVIELPPEWQSSENFRNHIMEDQSYRSWARRLDTANVLCENIQKLNLTLPQLISAVINKIYNESFKQFTKTTSSFSINDDVKSVLELEEPSLASCNRQATHRQLGALVKYFVNFHSDNNNNNNNNSNSNSNSSNSNINNSNVSNNSNNVRNNRSNSSNNGYISTNYNGNNSNNNQYYFYNNSNYNHSYFNNVKNHNV